jgi:hypothetical protein
MGTEIYRSKAYGGERWEEIGFKRRSLFGALGLRGPLMDLSAAEAALVARYGRGARTVVEIGVFEGAAAAAVKRVMDPDGTLTLVDPYPRGRLGINMARAVARRSVRRVPGADPVWVREFSDEAARGWSQPIDFLRIDGRHDLEGVQADWREWARWVRGGGHVMLRQDVVAEAVGSRDEQASGDEIVPWILADSPDWEVLERVESSAILRRRAGTGPSS